MKSHETTRRAFLGTTGALAVGLGCGALSSCGRGHGADGDETGPRWALVIDTTKCAGAADCVAAGKAGEPAPCRRACHTTHNVPTIKGADGKADPQEEIKWIFREPYEQVFHGQEQEYLAERLKDRLIPVLCNHCDNPPCVRVCPTQATWKRADGIVMMDMHRCIGCRYCLVACPYGSRSFNWSDPRRHLDMTKLTSDFPTRSKGVVEKCTFCAERKRLSKDGRWTPACVEACGKRGAMHWGDLNDPESAPRKILAQRLVLRRKPELGTQPHVFYLVDEDRHA